MSAWEIAIGIIIIIISLILFGVIMLQEGNTRNMGSVMPESTTDSYLGNNKGRTFDAILARITKICAVLFFILTIAINLLSVLNK